MKTQKDIEKGCGKNVVIDYAVMQEAECGAINPINKRIVLCPTCQALLQQSKEFVEMIEKRIEEFEEIIIEMKDTEQKVKYNCIKKRWTQEDKIKEVICNLKEIKSSIIGNKEKK